MAAINQKMVSATLAGALGIAAALIMPFEGQHNVAYLDPPGIPTICFGHTKNVTLGRTASNQECITLLKEDLSRTDEIVKRLVKVKMTENTHAATISFVFNVGAGNFANSTYLKKLNAGDLKGACDQLPRWVYSGGKKLPGLVKRREAERTLCLE